MRATLASLVLSWHVAHPSELAGFRVRWRPTGSPGIGWSAPVALSRRARTVTLGGLSPQPYEVKGGAIRTGRERGGHRTGFGTPLAVEEPPAEELPSGETSGQVRLVKDANSTFDFQDTVANAAWINEHFYRMTGYTSWFDKNL